MRFYARTWCPIVFLVMAQISHAGRFVSGRVVDIADIPLAGATIALSGSSETAVSDAEGYFVLGDWQLSVSGKKGAIRHAVRFYGNQLFLAGPLSSEKVTISLYTLNGVLTQRTHLRPESPRTGLTVFTRETDGHYVCVVDVGATRITRRAIRIDGRTAWDNAAMPVISRTAGRIAALPAAVDTVSASLAGYETAKLPIYSDTAFNVTLRLGFSALEIAPQVSVVETTITCAVRVAMKTKALNADDGLYYPGEGWIVDASVPYATVVRNDIKVVIIDNGLIRLVVSPTLGMRVIRATDLTHNKELFYTMDTLQGYRVWDAGGVEPSWPMYEHGLHLFDEPGPAMSNPNTTPFQSAGYRIVRESDGSVLLAMNMQFFQYSGKAESSLQGRYADRPLCSWIRVNPGRAAFSTSYRIDNPNPLRRGDRLWNDALFVKGTANSRIILPVRWATDHATDGVYDLDTVPGREAQHFWDRKMYSMFGLYAQHPFAGVYYPDENVNRVRIHDPRSAPGMKCFVHKGVPFIEFWGGTGVVFECPGSFVDAWSPIQFTNSYFLTPDIGMLSYANDYCAIGVDTAAGTFRIWAPQRTPVRVEAFDGSLLAEGVIGPGIPVLSGSCAARQIVVKSGQRELARASFPLAYPDNIDSLEPVRQNCLRSLTAWKLPTLSYGANYDNRRGFNYEAEGTQNNTYVMRDYHGLRAASKITTADTPDYILSIARICYRYKRFNRALELCAMVPATDADHVRHADYLKGLIAWERGQTVSFATAGIESNYHRALLKVAAGDKDSAIDLLGAMCAARPDAYRPALLAAYLRHDVDAALNLLARNPASVEALTILARFGVPGMQADLDRIIAGNRGAGDVKERFEAELTRGAWTPVPRWPNVPSGSTYGVSE